MLEKHAASCAGSSESGCPFHAAFEAARQAAAAAAAAALAASSAAACASAVDVQAEFDAEFDACGSFDGQRPGFEFKSGPLGVGYYKAQRRTASPPPCDLLAGLRASPPPPGARALQAGLRATPPRASPLPLAALGEADRQADFSIIDRQWQRASASSGDHEADDQPEASMTEEGTAPLPDWKVALEKFDLVLLEASEEHPEHDEASYWSSLLEQEE